MCTALFGGIENVQNASQITVTKYENGVRRDICGAFSRLSDIRFVVEVDTSLNIRDTVIRVQPDGRNWFDIPLIKESEGRFSLEINAAKLSAEPRGDLIWYEFLLISDHTTYFTHTENNCTATLRNCNSDRFCLLLTKEDSTTPDWFKGNIMYQIFTDRFCRGGNVPVRDDAVINPDWENGIPQFAAEVGGHLDNNEFFGGTLYGIADKLDYIASLGVGVIYLNPIFEAYSNHKYDTANYMKVDEMFGGDEALDHLITEADKRGIRIILDGVFNHTGNDSLYFNAKGRYPEKGAMQGKDSPYYTWYNFTPDGKYEAWWGIEILPRLKHEGKGCSEYFLGENGVIANYLKKGTAGWRLDVADELSDPFLDGIGKAAKSARNDALIIGEVWENAAIKIAYGKRRRYFLGDQLDSVMNYPFRNAVIAYLQLGDASVLADTLTEIFATYPRQNAHCLMNILGTHDTERILSVLGDDEFDGLSATDLSTRRLSEEKKQRAVSLLKLASAIQYTVYGVPSVYYGDEAGMEGYRDPFCRMPYPWGREDSELREHYEKLGRIRREEDVFRDGEFEVVYANGPVLIYKRKAGDKTVYLAANASDVQKKIEITGRCTDLLTGDDFCNRLTLPPCSARIVKAL
ncbi:MAG: glycoside hydrolase family 13 protein [Clostridia bacterium]|nr:glycoside hydrolase family 13 protein [Clostridia bacterium]